MNVNPEEEALAASNSVNVEKASSQQLALLVESSGKPWRKLVLAVPVLEKYQDELSAVADEIDQRLLADPEGAELRPEDLETVKSSFADLPGEVRSALKGALAEGILFAEAERVASALPQLSAPRTFAAWLVLAAAVL